MWRSCWCRRRLPSQVSLTAKSPSIRAFRAAAFCLERHQFTLLLQPTRDIHISNLQKALESHRVSASFFQQHWGQETIGVVILLTQTLAHWLNEVSKLLNPLFEDAFASHEDGEIDVVVAVVDGVSEPAVLDGLSHSSKEGISILQDRSIDLFPNRKGLDQQATSQSSTRPGITFAGVDKANIEALRLPLANTLFFNGRHSTMFKSKYRWSSQHHECRECDRTFLDHQVIQCFRNKVKLNIPAVSLSPAREVISGMGNIVRELNFSETSKKVSGPASKELEVNVTAYLDRTDVEKASIAVWALVTKHPTGLVPEWLSSSENPKLHNIGPVIEKGARLCRVLSGGGGWGIKQGLLSLDPQVTSDNDDAVGWMYPAQTFKQHQEAALGWSIQPGAWIQFFILRPHQGVIQEYLQWGTREHENPSVQTTLFGAIGGSDIQSMSYRKATSKTSGQDASIIPRPGHFGAVSEAGFFITRQARASENGETAAVGETILQEGASTLNVQGQSSTSSTELKIDMPSASCIETV